MLMVQPPFPVDNSPLCTIQVQQIVTSSGLKRWRSAGPIREVRRMDRMSFWLASSRWRGWQWPAEHPQQPRVCHIGHGSIPSKKNDPYRSPTVAAPVLGTFPQSIFKLVGGCGQRIPVCVRTADAGLWVRTADAGLWVRTAHAGDKTNCREELSEVLVDGNRESRKPANERTV